jgi:hypothetical protein
MSPSFFVLSVFSVSLWFNNPVAKEGTNARAVC